jgi:hypothetical protein
MKKIHIAIFYPLVVLLPIAVILLAFGNVAIGAPLMVVCIALFFANDILVKGIINESLKEAEKENTYKGPSRMEFLEANLGNDLIGKQEGFDEAVMGFDYHSMRLIYSVEKLIEILMAQNNWDYEGAQEYAYFNIIGARGEDEPIWLECSVDVEL